MKILISALEPSANLHLEPILNLLNEYELFGIFDERFGKPLLPSRSFSIMGFIDAIPKINLAKKAIKNMVELSFKVDKIILIDSSAFNLPLAKAIKKKNPKAEIIYYILPQVWAWKKKRVKKMEKYCDILASILPFEKQFYNHAIYVGHPLLDEIKEYKEEYKETGSIAFLPGSRKSEIKKLMPIFKEVAKKINKKNILVIPKHFSKLEISEIYGDIKEFFISNDTCETFLQSEFAFVCSGTATLEASLIGTPLVLAYKAKKFDAFIAKIFVKLRHVGLANILFDFAKLKPLHVELLQDDVTVKNLLYEYENIDKELYFKNSKKLRTILKHGSKEIMAKLFQPSKTKG